MMHERYEALEEHDLRWLGQGVGVSSGLIAQRARSEQPIINDSAGRVVTAAHNKYGAEFAAEVCCAVKRGSDAVMIANGGRADSDDEFIQAIGSAMTVALERPEVEAVQKILRGMAARGPLTSLPIWKM